MAVDRFQCVRTVWAGMMMLILGGLVCCASTDAAEVLGEQDASNDASAQLDSAGQDSSAAEENGARSISVEAALADFDRMWEIVRDTHFDPNFNGVDWDAVREEYRPKAEEARSPARLRRVLTAALGELGQSHFGIIPGSITRTNDAQDEAGGEAQAAYARDRLVDAETDAPENEERARDAGVGQENDADTGIDIRIIDDQAVVSSVRAGSPAAGAGVEMGWILSRIEGEKVQDILGELSDSLNEHEMEIHAVSLISTRLQGRADSTIELTFLDAKNKKRKLDVGRQPMPGEFVKFGGLPPLSTHLEWSRETRTTRSGKGLSIGVIRFNIWMIPIAPRFERAMYELRNADGLIIDVRGNPGGVGALASAMSRFLVSKRGSLGTMKMRGAELQFNIEPVVVTSWGERIEPFKGPIAILTDSGTASTSEVFAGGLQSLGRVRVIGARSAGMALPAAMDVLPSGDTLLHAIADFQTSTGHRLEEGGVVPDEDVPMTRSDLLKGIDSAQRAAMDWIVSAVK